MATKQIINCARSGSKRASFDIRTDCFVCGSSEPKRKKNVREYLTSVCTGTGQKTSNIMSLSAKRRHDTDIIARMELYKDLFAYDAKYHRSCYSMYISEKNLQAAESMFADTSDKNPYDKAFVLLVDNIERLILGAREPVVSTLSDQLSTFIVLVRELGVQDTNVEAYKSRKLKNRLKAHFHERLCFIPRHGSSDLMCSGDITVAQAMLLAQKLQDQLNIFEEMDGSNYGGESDFREDDYLVLHRAAGILRKLITEMAFDRSCYVSACDVTADKCYNFVPKELYNFLRWTCDESAFLRVSVDDQYPQMDILSIRHNLISIARSQRTPLTLATAIHMHHTVGSKQLIDVMSKLGVCVPYDEVMRFLTSVAQHHISESEVYVPDGIRMVTHDDTSSFISAAMDNFDCNEETLDGKGTTHSMASVVFQQTAAVSGTRPDKCKLPRRNSKVIDLAQLSGDQIVRFPPNRKRPEPPSAKDGKFLDVDGECISFAAALDLTWILARYFDTDGKYIPSWTEFNNFIMIPKSTSVTAVRYMPFVRESPTDLSTIYTTLRKLVSVAEARGQSHITVTADLGIYSKAVQVVWSNPRDLMGKVTMRLGGMHLLMTFIASIGKLFGDGGVEGVLVAADIYAPSTARMIFEGKHFNRGVRALKLLYEALCHLLLSGAEYWCASQGLCLIDPTVNASVDEVHNVFSGAKVDTDNTDTDFDISHALELLDKFRSDGRKRSATFKFWDDFLRATGVMLRLIRAERSADFILHLNSICEAIPYFIMSDRQNYARFAPIYVAEMRSLEHDNPRAYEHLNAGGFVVRRSSRSKFNAVPSDQALEQSVNKDAKTAGGVIGFTKRKTALLRWLMTRHVTAEYSSSVRNLVCKGHLDCTENTACAKVCSRDSRDVKALKTCFREQFENPFDLDTVPSNLVNIVTGCVANSEVETALSDIVGTGKSIMQTIATKQLVEGRKGSFWDKMSKVRTKTFSSMRKTISLDQGQVVSCSSEVLFRRLLAVSTSRDINLSDIMKYELAAVPPSLFNDDGSMRKTCKSDLFKKLESCGDVVSPDLTTHFKSGEQSAYIIDGMAMLQALSETSFKTFNDLAEIIVLKITKLLQFRSDGASYSCVVLVFDRYDNETSVKSYERHRRSSNIHPNENQTHKISGGRDVPNFRKFMSNSRNKSELAAFVCERMSCALLHSIQHGKVVMLAGGFRNGAIVKELTDAGCKDRLDLCSDQEQADTRMILHCVSLASSYQKVIIRSDDTDVLVLLVYYSSIGMLSPEVFIHTGHASKEITRARYVSVHGIVASLGIDVCKALPAMHSLTGCDTANSLFKIGKKSAFKKLIDNIETVKNLSEFGVSKSVNTILNISRNFILLLYSKKNLVAGSLDELRYMCAAKTNASCATLRPTEGSFRMHALRAHYQTCIWQNSHIQNAPDINPLDFGWEMNASGFLQPTMNGHDCVPSQLRNISNLFCGDKTCLSARKCPCLQSGLKCIDLCSCSDDCPNNPSANNSSEDDVSSDEDL